VLAASSDGWLKLVDAPAGPGIAGVPVELYFESVDPSHPYAQHQPQKGPELKLVSEAGGLVRLKDVSSLQGSVEITHGSDPARVLRPRLFDVAELGPTAESALEIVCARAETALFRGRLVDADTGKGVGQHGIWVGEWFEPRRARGGPGRLARRWHYFRPAWSTTAGDGTFESVHAYPEGQLTLTTHLHQEVQVDHVPGAERVDVPIPVGPLVRLDFDPPSGYESGDFLALLDQDPEERFRQGVASERWESEAGERPDTHPFGWNAPPVQGGLEPWVRFNHYTKREPLPSFLGIVSTDGHWRGYAPIRSFAAHLDDPLRIELEARAALSGSVAWNRGPGIDGLEMALERDGAASPEGETWRYVYREHGRDEVHFRYQGLEAGRWRLRFAAHGYRIHEEVVELRTGQTAHLRVVLEPERRDGSISGTIRSQSGANLDGTNGTARLQSVRMRHVDGAELGFGWADVSWNAGTGTFRASELPPGQYEVHPEWWSSALPIAPLGHVTTSADGHVEFFVNDDVPKLWYDVLLVGDKPGVDLRVLLEWSQGGTQARSSGTTEVLKSPAAGGRGIRLVSIGPVMHGGSVRGHVLGEGLRPIWLDDGSFAPPDGEGHRRAEVVFERGWGVRLQTLDESGRPLSGIVLSLDDAPLSPSDSEGYVIATAASQPRSLGVISAGWELAEWAPRAAGHGHLLPDTGEFTTSEGRLSVTLRPR